MYVPTDYKLGYERARAVSPELASKYIEHTQLGDPLAEEMAADLEELGSNESRRLIQTAMDRESDEALPDAPASFRKFFDDAETPPDWLDYQHSPQVFACFTGTLR